MGMGDFDGVAGFFRKGLVRRDRNLVQAWSIQMRGKAQARVRRMLMVTANRMLPVWPKEASVALKTVAPALSMMGPCRR